MRIDPTILRQQVGNLKVGYPELFENDDEWLITLESETDLFEVLDTLIAGDRDDRALANALKASIDEMLERAARFERRVKARRKLMYELMRVAGLPKAERPGATLSIRKGSTSVQINDEASVPDIFCDFKRTPNKTRIKEAIERGDPINWAAVVQGEPTLGVRVK